MSAPIPSPPGGLAVLVGALVWLLVAVVLGGSGALLGLRPPVLLLLVASLAIVLLIASWVVPALRRFAEGADLRILASFHLVRFLGVCLLLLGARGLLPSLLVVTAGLGNLVVAVLALALIALVPPGSAGGSRWWIGWNLLGLLVGLSIAITIVILARTDPQAMRIFLVLPLSLIPSFVAPIAIATHVWMLGRLLTD